MAREVPGISGGDGLIILRPEEEARVKRFVGEGISKS
jgi:hypothetical protein